MADDVQLTIRIPLDLKEKLQNKAADQRRSLNKQISYFLERMLSDTKDTKEPINACD